MLELWKLGSNKNLSTNTLVALMIINTNCIQHKGPAGKHINTVVLSQYSAIRKPAWDACICNIDESQRHQAVWKKLVSKGYTQRFHLYDTLEKTKLRRWRRDQDLAGVTGEGRVWLRWGSTRNSSAVTELFSVLIMVVFTQIHAYVKTLKMYKVFFECRKKR